MQEHNARRLIQDLTPLPTAGGPRPKNLLEQAQQLTEYGLSQRKWDELITFGKRVKQAGSLLVGYVVAWQISANVFVSVQETELEINRLLTEEAHSTSRGIHNAIFG